MICPISAGFCTECGCLSVRKLTNLGKPCEGVANSHGRQNLSKLARDLLPRNITCWPHKELVGQAKVEQQVDEADTDLHLTSVQSQVDVMASQQFLEALAKAPESCG